MTAIRSIAKAGQLLALFSSEHPVIRVGEASRRLGLTRSTVSRLFSTLAGAGIVALDESGVGYRPGPRVLALAQLATGWMSLRGVALPVMRELVSSTRETVGLHIRSGDHRVCIEVVPSPQELRWVAALGVPLPLHAGSAGKVLLAHAPADDLDRYLRAGLRALTAHTITDARKFRAELARVRRAGYAVSVDERAVNVSGVAAPVRDALGTVIAVLACAGPTSRWTRRAMERAAPAVVAAADRISRTLGYRASRPTSSTRKGCA
ncbi:MAG TPA: IclR family transcriptional regulator [bacterium]|nr:IclR family transcriptional regulator [bacterium]